MILVSPGIWNIYLFATQLTTVIQTTDMIPVTRLSRLCHFLPHWPFALPSLISFFVCNVCINSASLGRVSQLSYQCLYMKVCEIFQRQNKVWTLQCLYLLSVQIWDWSYQFSLSMAINKKQKYPFYHPPKKRRVSTCWDSPIKPGIVCAKHLHSLVLCAQVEPL